MTIQDTWAQTPTGNSTSLKFVYIHGSNQNTPESHEDFNRRVLRLHPYIVKALLQEPLARTHLLENGRLSISPQTINYFWGDLSHDAIDAVRRNIDSNQLMGGWPHLSERARITLATTLHDAVWLEKESRKKEVLNGLFEVTCQQNDLPVVLMGHSAGSLIIYNFLIYRLPYLDVTDFARWLHADPEVLEILASSGISHTCLEALLASGLVRMDAQGRLVPFFQAFASDLPRSVLENLRKEKLRKLPEYTRQYSIPADQVRALVTFGSPLILFYSTVTNPKFDESYLTAKMLHYILTHNIAWLHVNHVKDFIALPMPDAKHMVNFILNQTGPPLEPEEGFIINHLIENRGPNLLNAHSWYWKKPDEFATEIQKAYREGYRDWYGVSEKREATKSGLSH